MAPRAIGFGAPVYSTDSLHSAVVELVALPGSRIRYTTIQNWSNDVYNLVTKRAHAYEDSTVEWIDANTGSKKTVKYPSIYLRGRGATAESILELRRELDRTDVAFAAPQASGFTWYPLSFLAPLEHNQPGLSSALAKLEAVLGQAEKAGIPERDLAEVQIVSAAFLVIFWPASTTISSADGAHFRKSGVRISIVVPVIAFSTSPGL